MLQLSKDVWESACKKSKSEQIQSFMNANFIGHPKIRVSMTYLTKLPLLIQHIINMHVLTL